MSVAAARKIRAIFVLSMVNELPLPSLSVPRPSRPRATRDPSLEPLRAERPNGRTAAPTLASPAPPPLLSHFNRIKTRFQIVLKSLFRRCEKKNSKNMTNKESFTNHVIKVPE